MKNAVLVLAVAVLMCCSSSRAQLPIVASFPSADSGWSLVGNVGPLNCAGTCKWFLPDVDGKPTVFPRTIGTSDKAEQQNDELLQVQSNGQDSSANLLVNVASFGYYTIAFDVQGTQSQAPLGGQTTYPTMEIVVNGSPINICRYPNSTAITCATDVLVNNPKGATHEYISSGQMTLFAGNNNIAVQIVGGQGHGGLLTVRHLLIYLTSGVSGYTMCQNPNNQQISHSIQNGGDLWTMQANANSWTQSTCGPSTGILPAVNLKATYYIPGVGCTTSGGPCALTEMQ